MTIKDYIELWSLHRITARTFEHLVMFGIALGIAIIIGIMLGMLVYWKPRYANPLFNILNILETIPALALLVLLLSTLPVLLFPS